MIIINIQKLLKIFILFGRGRYLINQTILVNVNIYLIIRIILLIPVLRILKNGNPCMIIVIVIIKLNRKLKMIMKDVIGNANT
ncbi:hypothetical protein PVBG_02452 [Plasmodium vivax Brazil I]|uniref:Uncharacterized protein n=1 Tax=Plasmodium vivax (strain Brazil I) TaxID=1033975 RepID=A0A0J9T083_PLAV1|nr:hypothetical protein PVBG_02452 [Plasmodium vivax Brazil I]